MNALIDASGLDLSVASAQTVQKLFKQLDSPPLGPYMPEYSLRALDEVRYIRVSRFAYIQARRYTMLGRSQKDPDEVSKIAQQIYQQEF